MIITEPKKLSMHQQVQKNKEDIESIFKKIDGLDSTDNVVVVPDIDHVMTPEELESVQEPVAFILFEDKVFIKKKIENNVAYFDIVFSIAFSTVITLKTEELEVDMFTGHLVHRVVSDDTYSVSQIDSKFATLTYVNNALAQKANLSGAAFTGAVSAPTLKQEQPNYSTSFSGTGSDIGTLESVYNRIEEINNVLYFVLNIKATATSAGTVYKDGLACSPSITLNSALAEKVIDLKGRDANQTGENVRITSVPCTVTKGLAWNSKRIPATATLQNSSWAGGINLYVAVDENFTKAEGEEYYIMARIPLTLI